MKQINEVFFGEKGVTSTSAHHVCNMGKEWIESTHKSLDSLNFVTTTVSDFDEKICRTIKAGVKLSEEDIMKKLSQVIEIHSLIAYLREAIKAKNEELQILKKSEFKCSVDFPVQPEKFEMEDAIAELNIKERNEYFSLEAEASVIGKFIHPKSPYDIARTALMDCVANPVELKELSNNILIYKKLPAQSVEEVDGLFFKLQRKHREVSAKLNAVKHKLQERVDEVTLSRKGEHNKALSDYKEVREKEETDFNISINKETKRIADLKIVIPLELESVFTFVNTL
jgi:hypothetical protein